MGQSRLQQLVSGSRRPRHCICADGVPVEAIQRAVALLVTTVLSESRETLTLKDAELRVCALTHESSDKGV